MAQGSNVITTVVDNTGGQGFAGDGQAATTALTDGPVGIFADSSGNLLVSDTGNQRIRQVTKTTGNINTIVGGSMGGDAVCVNGTCTGGAPTSAMLANPWDVAEDAAGDLYIVDQANNRIRKITNPLGSNAQITTVAGTGSAGDTGDNGLATSATLNGPSAIALDTAGNLYILDANNLVVRAVNTGATTLTFGSGANLVTIAPGDIATVFGNNTLTCVPTASCGDTGPPLGAIFQGPLFVTLDANNNEVAPVEVAELHAPFTHQEILLREALGLGDGVVVNPSGGALCGNPMFAAGLARIGMAAQAVMSGQAQRALGHATSGPALQQNLVCAVEAR